MKTGRMTRRLVCVLILASVTLLGAAAQAAPERRFVIATAGTAGALYPMGVAMAETINKHSDRFVASAESSAVSVADLKGKRTGVGSPGSGGEVDARMVVACYGLDYKSAKPSYITDSEMVSALRDGSLDWS